MGLGREHQIEGHHHARVGQANDGLPVGLAVGHALEVEAHAADALRADRQIAIRKRGRLGDHRTEGLVAGVEDLLAVLADIGGDLGQRVDRCVGKARVQHAEARPVVGVDVREDDPVHRLAEPGDVVRELLGMPGMEDRVEDYEAVGRLHDLRGDVEPLLGSVVAVDGHAAIVLRGDLSQGCLRRAHDEVL